MATYCKELEERVKTKNRITQKTNQKVDQKEVKKILKEKEEKM